MRVNITQKRTMAEMGLLMVLEFVVANAPKTLGPAGSFKFFKYVEETLLRL